MSFYKGQKLHWPKVVHSIYVPSCKSFFSNLLLSHTRIVWRVQLPRVAGLFVGTNIYLLEDFARTFDQDIVRNSSQTHCADESRRRCLVLDQH